MKISRSRFYSQLLLALLLLPYPVRALTSGIADEKLAHSDLMTKRQTSIAQLWATPNVYTPAMVVDGREWRDWRNKSVAHLPDATKEQNLLLTLFRLKDGSYSVKVGGQKMNSNYVVHLAILGMGIQSKITGGENEGNPTPLHAAGGYE